MILQCAALPCMFFNGPPGDLIIRVCVISFLKSVSSGDEAAGAYLLHKVTSTHSSASPATHQCLQTCTGKQ